MNFARLFYAGKSTLKKHSPEIMMVAGTVAFVGTVILACRATTKVSRIVDSHKEQLNSVKASLDAGQIEIASEDGEGTELIKYDEKEARKDKAIIFAHTALDITKLYGPSILLGAASIALFFGAYKIVHGRYVAMSTVACGLSRTLENYRKRVKEELGEEMDQHFLTGSERKEVGVVTTIDENGKTKKSKTYVQVLPDGTEVPIYSFFFDEECPEWSKSAQLNVAQCLAKQNAANDMFKIHGQLLLNEVRRLFRLPPTVIGSKVGWFESHGDNFVDFGLGTHSEPNERVLAFLDGYERNVLIVPNCVPVMEGDLAYA